MLNMSSHELKHALSALISVVVSTGDGVKYITRAAGKQNFGVVDRLIDILKEQEDGSVTQRFIIAILQKMTAQSSANLEEAVTESVIDLMTKKNMEHWCLSLLAKGQAQDMHMFCLDFSSALLANLLHATGTLEMLEADQRQTEQIMDQLLNLILGVQIQGGNKGGPAKHDLPTSVLIHCLICLSYLSKERFNSSIESCQFVDRISQFVEMFSVKHVGESDQESTDKKTILDLCAHMFHPKDTTNANDVSATMEYNELKQEEKIREFQNAQGDLIFECFQDEVN